MGVFLKRLSADDGIDIYEMLQEMPKDENGFLSPVYGKTFEEYKRWLIYDGLFITKHFPRPLILYMDGKYQQVHFGCMLTINLLV